MDCIIMGYEGGGEITGKSEGGKLIIIGYEMK